MNWLDPQEVREWRDKLIARHEKCPPVCDDRDDQIADGWSEFGRAVAARPLSPKQSLEELKRSAHSVHWNYDDALAFYWTAEQERIRLITVARLIRDAEEGR